MKPFPISGSLPSILLITACFALPAGNAGAAEFTLPVTDPGGTSSFTNPLTGATATGWTGGAPVTTKNPPASGNTYTIGGGATAIGMRGPTAGVAFTFPGDSLTLLGNGRFLFKNPPAVAQTLTVPNLILNGGVLDLANAGNDFATATFAGAISLGANSANGGIGALTGETFTVAATISGAGPLVVAGANVNAGADTGTVILSGANTNTGGATLNAGRVLIGVSNATTVSGALGASAGDVTLGATTGANPVSLLTNGAFTFSNNLIVRAGGTGLLTFGGNTPDPSVFSGNVTLNQNATVALPFGGTLSLTGNISSGTAGARNLTFNTAGNVSQSTGVISNGAGTVSIVQSGTGATTLGGANTFGGQVSIFTGGSIIASSLNSVVGGTPSSNLGAPLTVEAGTFIMGGNSAPGNLIYNGPGETTDRAIRLQAFSTGSNGVIDQSGTGLLKFTGGITNTSGSKHVITFQGSTDGTGEISGAITNGTGLAVTKNGTGTWTLSGQNTYTGDTTVYDGTLVLKTPSLYYASSVYAYGISILKLDYVGTATVKALYFDGTPVPDGIYGSDDPSGFLAGTGKIKVLSVGYASWSTTNAGDQGAQLDFDNDGVKNGVEFFMGATGSTFTANPAIIGSTLTFPKSAAYTGTYHFQTSPDLVVWTDATTGITDTGTSVSFVVPNVPGKQFVRLKVEPE
ncbi:MAG: autotransporter-associated beta strand repeat-containing protein [Luteolibacter sp.]|uniref:beta strand repeat-containing protein n=1 Tax=Luteolibacter sp. TaxID=1962973 RepID=UPI0032630570